MKEYHVIFNDGRSVSIFADRADKPQPNGFQNFYKDDELCGTVQTSMVKSLVIRDVSRLPMSTP